MIDIDMIKALRCLASQDAEGNCYEDVYNLRNWDKQKISCGSGFLDGSVSCPYYQNKYEVCFEDGECGEWLNTVADELEMMSEKGDGWIYRNPYQEYEELFKRIEAALGFNLFIWQKSFIVTGHFRQYGETTAKILKELLDIEAAPLDYTRRCMNSREDFYRHELREIQERLKDAGIKTRVVFWSVGDKRRYAETGGLTGNE